MSYHNNGIMVENINVLMEYWDVKRNNEIGLDPGKIPVNSSINAFWKCKNGHHWQERVSRVYDRKIKCLYCEGRMVWSGENDLQTLHPKLASEWDCEKNYVTPDKVSPKDTKKYWWKCKNGHPSFLRSVEHRVTRNDACPYCTGRKIEPGVNDLQTLFPNIASEWDLEKNKIEPCYISPNSEKSYYWICPKGHHYSKNVYRRTHSKQAVHCPKCVHAHSTSFPEQALYFYTKQFYPDAINRYRGLTESGLELDIYIPSWNIGIEYDGKLFHSSKEAKEREERKYNICKRKHIKLIRVKEGEFSDDDWFRTFSDETYYIKKRPNDNDMDMFLISFFTQLTEFSHSHFVIITDPKTNKKTPCFQLPVDINIKRDRPKILEYLIDIDNSFGSLYPELAKNWDYEMNGSLTPFMLPPGSNYIAYFKCPRCGKSWSASISAVTQWKRQLCKKCSMGENGKNCTKRMALKNGSLAENYPQLINQWDEEKNGELTPNDIPAKYHKRVYWKCPDCGYGWFESPSARIHGDRISSCPHCSGRVAFPGVDDLQTLYPDLASEWDYEKNVNVVPSEIKPGSNTPRYWICKKHNVSFRASPANRLRGGGCRLCKSEKIIEKNGFRLERYTKDLKLIKTYNSINEAGRDLNISPEAIRQAAIHGAFSGNSYWKYEGQEFSVLKPDKKHSVIATNISTGEKIEFESAREAERITGVGHTKIMKCCKKEPLYKSAGGFRWEFKE